MSLSCTPTENGKNLITVRNDERNNVICNTTPVQFFLFAWQDLTIHLSL